MAELYDSIVIPKHKNCATIQDAVSGYLKRAKSILGDVAVAKINNIIIEFFARGADAAVATVGSCPDTGNTIGVIQFSMHHTRKRIWTMVNQIVPHELAHVICMANGWDEGHGKIWRRICKMLGGNGSVYNTMGVVDGRFRWAYEASHNGHTYWLNGSQKREAVNDGFDCYGPGGEEIHLTWDSLTGNIKPIEELYFIYA